MPFLFSFFSYQQFFTFYLVKKLSFISGERLSDCLLFSVADLAHPAGSYRLCDVVGYRHRADRPGRLAGVEAEPRHGGIDRHRPDYLRRPGDEYLFEISVGLTLTSCLPQRRLIHQGDLLTQFHYPILPVALRIELREGHGESRVVPATRDPCRMVDQA